MKSLFKVSVHFNKVFENRGGRFITVYQNGKHINGKVLGTNLVWATIQPAADPKKKIRMLNFKVRVVNADHCTMTMDGNLDRRQMTLLF